MLASGSICRSYHVTYLNKYWFETPPHCTQGDYLGNKAQSCIFVNRKSMGHLQILFRTINIINDMNRQQRNSANIGWKMHFQKNLIKWVVPYVAKTLCIVHLLKQSSAVITPYNLSRYYIRHGENSGRKWIRYLNHNTHPTGEMWDVYCGDCRANRPRFNGTALYVIN